MLVIKNPTRKDELDDQVKKVMDPFKTVRPAHLLLPIGCTTFCSCLIHVPIAKPRAVGVDLDLCHHRSRGSSLSVVLGTESDGAACAERIR